MESPAVRILDLHKTYREASHPSVDGLSLTVRKGSFFGLLGPNGAGKTTTISILCGLRAYDSGQVLIHDLDVKERMPQIKPLIGVVPQDIALYPELTVDENLRFFGRMYRLQPEALKSRMETYLRDFGLMPHRTKKTGYLSGGMKRQVNLIAALLHRPSLLFLDEPTVGVDVHSRQVILKNLQDLHRGGITVIYTSHDMKEAETLCTDVALMDHGHMICRGVPRELMERESASSLEDLFIKKTLT
ncbi:MAG: ABC transporter ATP-binding protein [Tannerella sp.]|jgi:ABC-2 type transport system ATP-binding protein|nr:ABC transporter ATP-binding protein [Tannerella sp.]